MAPNLISVVTLGHPAPMGLCGRRSAELTTKPYGRVGAGPPDLRFKGPWVLLPPERVAALAELWASRYDKTSTAPPAYNFFIYYRSNIVRKYMNLVEIVWLH